MIPKNIILVFKKFERKNQLKSDTLNKMGHVQSIDIAPTMKKTNENYLENEGPIYKNIHCDIENGGNLISTFRSQPESKTIIDILKGSSNKFSELDCVGERKMNNDIAGEYVYINYKTFYERCLAFGKGLIELGLQRGDKIGIYSNNSIWWQTAAFGAYSVGLVIVPVYDSLGPDASEYILNHAEIKVLITNKFKFNSSCELSTKSEQLTHILTMFEEIPQYNVSNNTKVISCNTILNNGFNSKIQNEFSKPNDLAVIMYTSGSTGKPKGCQLLHSNIVAGATGLGCVNMSASTSDTYLSFLPLAHIYAMSVELMMYAQGVRIAFARGPVADLLDDIKTMQPTIICVVPRILNRIVESMKKKISELKPILKTLIIKTMESKISLIKQNKPQSLLLDMLLFKDFRAALGGRVRLIVSGGAPIMTDVFEFLAATITPNIVQGYGLTEVAAGLAVQEIPVFNPATVGASAICCEIKLRKVEGTEYNPLDEIPKGELLVRGPNVFQGYYKQPELTKEVLSEDGWFATGDVVKITPEGQIQIIDRAKQLVKLCQGEYISLTTLTDYYSMAENISFIYVYADSMHDRPIAVVIPKPEKIKEWISKGYNDFKTNEITQKELINSLNKVFEEKKMRGFEKITTILIDDEEPTIANGLLTPSMKPQFNSLKKKYENSLKELY